MISKDTFLQAHQILTHTIEELHTVLGDFPAVQLQVGSQLGRIQSRLAFLAGHSSTKTATSSFGPLRQYMGQALPENKEISPDQLTTQPDEKELFIRKVDQLYQQIDTLSPESLLDNYNHPEDHIILRGVAKRAGVETYEDDQITVSFIEKIATAKKNKSAATNIDQRIEKELKEQKERSKKKTEQ